MFTVRILLILNLHQKQGIKSICKLLFATKIDLN